MDPIDHQSERMDYNFHAEYIIGGYIVSEIFVRMQANVATKSVKSLNTIAYFSDDDAMKCAGSTVCLFVGE